MDESNFQQPTLGQLEAFIDGDPIIINEVMRLVIPQLHRWAIKQYSNLPVSEVQSVVHQVLAETCHHHARYSPTGAKFTTYLINLIKRRMIDLHERHIHITHFEEHNAEARENSFSPSYNSQDEVGVETKLTRAQFFQLVMGQLDEPEREFLDLILQGEKSQELFASVLKRHGRVVNQSHDVKNMKARLLRKLKTLAMEKGFEMNDLIGR